MPEETKKVKKPSKTADNFKKLVKNFIYFLKLYFKSAPYHFSVYFILFIISAIFPALTSKIFGNLVDSLAGFIKSGDTTKVWYSLFTYAVIFIIPNVVDVLINLFSSIARTKFVNYLIILIAKKRGSLDIARIEDSKFQDLIQNAFSTGTAGPIIDIMARGVSSISRFLVVVISSVLILSLDWRIFFLVVVLSLPKLFYKIKFGGLGYSIDTEHSLNLRVAQNLIKFFTDKFSVIESKLFQIQDLFLDKISKIRNDFSTHKIFLEKEVAKYSLLSEVLATVGIFVGLGLAVNGALKGNITVGTVVFIFSIVSAFNSNISTFLENIAKMMEQNLYVSDIVKVLDTKSIFKEVKNPKIIEKKVTPEIEFLNVSFKYPGQDNYVLKNLSFKIKSGQKIGLVGHNGAGKTTIIRMLLRIHDPVEGQILVNGIDLKNLSLQDWWSQLAVLPQDFTSFNFEAKHSISYGDITKKFDIEKVKFAAKQSTASEFIEKWDDQYERMIGVEFGGAELSKGERQKMALARVFYRNSPIIVLDEPTAAIDSKSTSEIFRNIENISDKQSMLIISHNFATLRRANKIIYLEHGEIIEEGTHEELMENKKMYSVLYDQQKEEYE